MENHRPEEKRPKHLTYCTQGAGACWSRGCLGMYLADASGPDFPWPFQPSERAAIRGWPGRQHTDESRGVMSQRARGTGKAAGRACQL